MAVLQPALFFLSLLASAALPGAIRVGDRAEHTWRAPLVNGLGVKSLEELRGKPLLFDFWGTR
jgi:hypothetical protein